MAFKLPKFGGPKAPAAKAPAAKKVAVSKKSSGTVKPTKGWFGGEGGAKLDKWYGEWAASRDPQGHDRAISPCAQC